MRVFITFFIAVLLTHLLIASSTSAEITGGSDLHAAARNNDRARIQTLLRNGAPVDQRDAAGATPLLVATRANSVSAAAALIAAGADVNAKDRIDDSPFLYAGASGHLRILRMTLRHGADLDSTNRFGGTAVIPAAERGHVETVRALIAAGIDVDHVNDLGWTALLEAIILGNGGPRYQKVVELLLRAGADPGLSDGEGVSPLQHAQRRGHRKIETLILAFAGQGD